MRSTLSSGLALMIAAAAMPRALPGQAGVAPSPAPEHPPFVIGGTQLRQLPRSANGRDYLLYVALPYDYATAPDKRYPTLFLCDGYWDFALVTGFYGNLVYDRAIPHFILVGLGYAGPSPDYDALRRLDLIPVPDPAGDPDGKVSGHGAEFLAVLEKEIIPFVEREYRADPGYRVLGGSSAGGLFALYAMLARPGLFQAYIAPSPAVMWANDWLFGFEEEFAARGGQLDARLFMTGAAGEWPDFLVAILRFHHRLESRAYPKLKYEWRLVDGERHAGTKAESYNRGIRHAFAPLAPRE